MRRRRSSPEAATGYPRKWLVDPDMSGFYHCVSRCVRRAFLCGGDFDYRRAWIEERLTFLISIFAIESCAYAIMSNHLHLILRILPELAKTWSNTEVVERWLRLYPKKLERITQGAATERDRRRLAAKYIKELADRPDLVQKWRKQSPA